MHALRAQLREERAARHQAKVARKPASTSPPPKTRRTKSPPATARGAIAVGATVIAPLLMAYTLPRIARRLAAALALIAAIGLIAILATLAAPRAASPASPACTMGAEINATNATSCKRCVTTSCSARLMS